MQREDLREGGHHGGQIRKAQLETRVNLDVQLRLEHLQTGSRFRVQARGSPQQELGQITQYDYLQPIDQMNL